MKNATSDRRQATRHNAKIWRATAAAGFALFICLPASAQDSVGVDAVYPPPRGIYSQLRTTNDTYLAMNAAAGGSVIIGDDAITTGGVVYLRRPGAGIHLDLDADAANARGVRFYKGDALGWSMEQDAANAMNFNYQGTTRLTIPINGTFTFLRDQGPQARLHDLNSDSSQLQLTNAATGMNAGDGFSVGLDPDENLAFSMREPGKAILFNVNVLGSSTEVFRITNDGKIGMHTPTPDPNRQMDVDGDYFLLEGGPASEFQLLSETSTSWRAVAAGPKFHFQSAPFDLAAHAPAMTINNNLRIGIGTVNPSRLLHIKAPANPRLLISAVDAPPRLILERKPGGVVRTYEFAVNAAGSLTIDSNQTAGTDMYFHQDGSVQIGADTNPSSGLLRVGGDVHIAGSYYCNQADIAERVPADRASLRLLRPGSLVAVDPDHDERVSLPRRAYDTAVLGVVSASPGWVLGGDVAEGVEIALVGRVKAYATAENGPIRPGDLLVSSSTPGYAMRGSPEKIAPGMVIGKAMEPLESGEGLIRVLVNLQ